jgi:hypothetical protein
MSGKYKINLLFLLFLALLVVLALLSSWFQK